MTEKEKQTLDDVLAHYGILGMRWGVRNKDRSSRKSDSSSSSTKPGVRNYDSRKLDNKELKRVIERMKLEQEYKNLNKKATGEGKKFTDEAIKKIPSIAITTVATFAIMKALEQGFDKYKKDAAKKVGTKVISKGATRLAKNLAL